MTTIQLNQNAGERNVIHARDLAVVCTLTTHQNIQVYDPDQKQQLTSAVLYNWVVDCTELFIEVIFQMHTAKSPTTCIYIHTLRSRLIRTLLAK